MSFYGKYTGMGGGGGGGGSGVKSLNTLIGDLTLVAGTGINITDNGANEITIASTSSGDVTIGAFGSTPNANGLSINGSQVLNMQPADATNPGGVSTTAQSFAGNKTFIGTIAASNLSGTNTGDVTLGTANGLSLVAQALSLGLSSTSTTGALSSTDWNTFNSKQAALTLTNLTAAGTDGITVTNGTGAVIGASPVTIQQQVATSGQNGYLSSTDWSTFNSKQAAGNYITALTGDATATGPGSVALTLATVNSNVGTFASVTVNGKGLVTAASALSGDATTSGATLTLATVNSNVGSFGSASSVGTFTVNGKGLITAAGSTSIQIAESQVTNLTTDLAGKQNLSTITAKGSLYAGSGSGTTVERTVGSNGQALVADSAQSSGLNWANVLTNPMTTGGDIIYGGASGTPTRLANGSAGQMLRSAGSTSAPTWSDTFGPTTGGKIVGTNTNDNAASGIVGEFISANPGGNVTPAASGSYVNVISISLTEGDWDVEAVVAIDPGSANTPNSPFTGISTTSANMDALNRGGFTQLGVNIAVQFYIPISRRRISVASTTTVYLVAGLSYVSLGTAVWLANSYISARRVR